MKLIFVVGECRKKMRLFFNISFQSPLRSVASFKRLQLIFSRVALWQHDRPSSDKEGHRAQIDRLSVLMSASKRHCGKRWGIGPRVRAMDLYKTHAVIHIGVHSTIEIPSRWDRTSEKRFLLQGDFSPANNFTNLDY